MASSSSQLTSANECVRHEINRLRLVCEVLARGVIRCRHGNAAGEFAKTVRCMMTESAGDEEACTADCIEEDER